MFIRPQVGTQFADFFVRKYSSYSYTDVRTNRSFHAHILLDSTYKCMYL